MLQSFADFLRISLFCIEERYLSKISRESFEYCVNVFVLCEKVLLNVCPVNLQFVQISSVGANLGHNDSACKCQSVLRELAEVVHYVLFFFCHTHLNTEVRM